MFCYNLSRIFAKKLEFSLVKFTVKMGIGSLAGENGPIVVQHRSADNVRG